MQYIWVIEKQRRGAPHFHIITPNYIDKELVNKAWNGVVSKWQKQNINEGVKQQQVYPNIGKVFEAGKYMTKYMQNEFNLNEFLDYTVPELGMKTYQ